MIKNVLKKLLKEFLALTLWMLATCGCAFVFFVFLFSGAIFEGAIVASLLSYVCVRLVLKLVR
jgi:hypothetical protein